MRLGVLHEIHPVRTRKPAHRVPVAAAEWYVRGAGVYGARIFHFGLARHPSSTPLTNLNPLSLLMLSVQTALSRYIGDTQLTGRQSPRAAEYKENATQTDTPLPESPHNALHHTNGIRACDPEVAVMYLTRTALSGVAHTPTHEEI